MSVPLQKDSKRTSTVMAPTGWTAQRNRTTLTASCTMTTKPSAKTETTRCSQYQILTDRWGTWTTLAPLTSSSY